MGEIWLAGRCRTLGYWNKPDHTRTIYEAQLKGTVKPESKRWSSMYTNWLRTGDMACWYNGQLYVTGRIKEMIIINGANLYPHDIEEAVKHAHPAIRPGSITVYLCSLRTYVNLYFTYAAIQP
jgi:fatty-acyl-CoA synthase